MKSIEHIRLLDELETIRGALTFVYQGIIAEDFPLRTDYQGLTTVMALIMDKLDQAMEPTVLPHCCQHKTH